MIGKKGAMIDVFIWIIIALVTIMFIGLWTYGHGLITDEITNTDNEMINNASEKTFGVADDAINSSGKILAFLIIAGLAINAILGNVMVRSHPSFLILYIFVAVVGIIFAATVSNIYTGEILPQENIGSTFQEFTSVNFIMQYLPYFAAIIAIFGGVFLLINIARDDGGAIP